METEELVARLRACLSERLPDESRRRELSAALRAWTAPGGEAGEKLVAELSATLERSQIRREVAMAAAHAMRLLMQAAAEAAASDDEDHKEWRSSCRNMAVSGDSRPLLAGGRQGGL